MRWISIKIQGVHWGSGTNFKPAQLHWAFSKPRLLPKEETSPRKCLLSSWCWGARDEGYLMARAFLSLHSSFPVTPWKAGEHPAYCPPSSPIQLPLCSPLPSTNPVPWVTPSRHWDCSESHQPPHHGYLSLLSVLLPSCSVNFVLK